MGYWNIVILTGKELELVKKAERYHLDIVEVSSTERRGSKTVGLDWGTMLFSADPSMSVQGFGGSHELPVVILCVRLDYLGITRLRVDAQGIGSLIVPIADICLRCYD